MTKLVWREASRLKTTRTSNIPCYEAVVTGGKYRVAPVDYIDPSGPPGTRSAIGYEAFFIPDCAQSMADVRDILEHLPNIEEAKKAAEEDYDYARCLAPSVRGTS
jgi:hypothetical protein